MVDHDSPSSPPNKQVVSTADFTTPAPESGRPALTITADAANSGDGIPFVMTADMKQQLHARGFSAEQIKNEFTPQLAHDAVAALPPMTAPDTRPIDLSEATRFLDWIDPSADALWCFQTLDDQKLKELPERIRLTKVLHASRDNLTTVLQHLEWLNARGAGIFLTINRTDGRGRRVENVTTVRALFLDLDGAPVAPVLNSARPPQLVTETSPGKFHCYLKAQDIAVQDFRAYQEALSDRFGGDPMVNAPQSVMRVPGFWHRKGEPFLTRIHCVNERPPYQISELEKKVQPVRTRASGEDKQAHPLFVAAAVASILNPDLHWTEWNRIGMAIYAATGGSDDGFEIFDSFSQKSSKYRARTTRARWQHYHRSPPQLIGFGTLHHLATQTDPDWLARLDQELMAAQQRAAQERRLYQACAVPTPEQQAATLKTAAAKIEAETRQSEQGAVGAPRPHSVLHWHGEARPSNAPWLVKNLMLQTGAGLVSGQWGTGKTFIVIHLAGCVMTGKDFVGYRVRRKGGVLFIAKEGKAALPLRLAVMVEHTLGRKDDAGLLPFAWADIPLNLLAQGSAALIALAKEAATEMQRRFGVPLVLIIIDTVPAAAGYKKEGEGAEGTFVMNALHALSEATGAFVLGVEHFGKDIEAGTRGTMTKEDRADTILALIGERTLAGQVSNLRLGVRKVREGESGREIPFRLELIDCGVDEDGDQVTSRIVHWELDRPVRPAAARQSKSSTIFATALQAVLDAHGNRQLFTELVAVPEYEVRKIFLTNYTAEEEVSAAAARERWRKARDRAIVTETVELRRNGDVSYLCCPVAAAAM